MLLIAISAFASMVYVFLRAVQQLNVVQDRFIWVVPTSVCMGIGDVVLITFIVKTDTLWIGVSNGLAAGLGCIFAMLLNRRGKAKAAARAAFEKEALRRIFGHIEADSKARA